MARIAHAGFLHETNTFAPLKATWDDFLRTESFPGLTEGSAVIERLIDVNIGTQPPDLMADLVKRIQAVITKPLAIDSTVWSGDVASRPGRRCPISEIAGR